MAITVTMHYPISGLTDLTLEVYPRTGGTILNGSGGDAFVQSDDEARPYEYVAMVSDALPAVVYQCVVKQGTAVVALAETLLGTIGDFVLGDVGLATAANVSDAAASIAAYGDLNWATATGFSTLDAAGIRTAVGLAGANLDTQLSAINSKTTNLPASPAAVGSAMTLTSAYDAAKTAAQAGSQMDLVDAPNSTAISAIQAGLATAANQTTILARIGTFTGSGVNTILGFLKAVMSKSASTPSDVGGTFSATTDSLEGMRDYGASNWGADGTVIVSPLAAGDVQRASGTTVVAYLGETADITVSGISDSSGDAIDLTAYTLSLVIEDYDGTDVQVVAAANITVTGANHNNFHWTPSAAVTASVRQLRWALRDTANGDYVLARGTIDVQIAAMEDA